MTVYTRLSLGRAGALVLAILMALVAGMTAGVVVSRGATVTVAPTSLVTYGAVFRALDTGRWIILGSGGPEVGTHVTAGITSVKCNGTTGFLEVYYEPVATVASVWVSTDETLTARGIIGGASVNVNRAAIRFSRMTANGPLRLHCNSRLLRGSNANTWFGLIGQPVTS